MKIRNIIFPALLLSAGALSFTGCTDSDIKPQGLTQAAATDASLDNINANIAAIRKAVESKALGSTVSRITRLADDDGCLIEFSDGNTVAFRANVGSMGVPSLQPSPTSYTPAVAAEADEDGVYYWTLDGEWLLAETTGKKIEVTGGKSVTPVLSVDADGHWVLDAQAYGRKVLGPMTSGSQTSAIQSIDVSDLENILVHFSSSTAPLSLAAGGGTVKPDDPVTGSLRRPISVESPAWLVHIDCWNYPDPVKIIELIPDDILPYVIFNLSLSVSHNEQTGQFQVSEYGYETVKSWLRTCAERNLWAMIQPSSGGFTHFPDVSSYSQFDEEKYGMYKEFFSEYPNFLGFNYCEQFWGFDSTDALGSPSWLQRVAHWNELLKLTHEYGGYLTVSFCANYWSAPINPVAMIKRNPEFARTSAQYAENFIMCEKYTQSGCFFDVEAECMGVWLSGHAGHYGIRFDQCAWNEWAGSYYFGKSDADYPVALGAALQLEHITLTGQTVIDGPELIWQQDFKEEGLANVGDGYQSRTWGTFPQFRNINIDLFRKILDGTIRLMTKKEVIERAKIVVIQDITSGPEIEQYCLPKWFHLGTSALDHDNGREDNHFYLRKTGRYPAVPVVAELVGSDANLFEYKYNQSSLSSWENTATKTRELNRIYPKEYDGDLFAGRHENTWVTYNPWVDVRSANIPLKYNTCESLDLTFETFTTGVWKEYSDRLTCYLTNYNENGGTVRSTIRINGASSQPSYTVTPRAEASVRTSDSWADGVLTLSIDHNGPLDITIECSGNGSDRLTDYTPATLKVPGSPRIYHGPRQYEAEVFDFKYVASRVTSGYNSNIRNYTGQGYINFGKRNTAAVRDEVSVIDEGRYAVKFRYRAESADVTTVDLYVNGEKVASPVFTQSGSDKTIWYVNSTGAYLNAGKNIIELKANAAGACDLYLDNMIIEPLP